MSTLWLMSVCFFLGVFIMIELILFVLLKKDYTPSATAQQAQRDVAALIKDANQTKTEKS